MIQSLKELTVILVLAFGVFWFASRTLCPHVMTMRDLRIRAAAWTLVTLAVFLSGNFWFYVLLSAIVLIWAATKDSNPLALFCFVLFAVPPFGMTVPGFGLVNYFFEMTHVNLVSLVILAPLAVHLLAEKRRAPGYLRASDLFVLGYLLVSIWPVIERAQFTNLMRMTFLLGMTVWLPYYVFSRHVRNLAGLRDVAASLAVAIGVLALIGIFELLRSWLLYGSLEGALGVSWSFGGFMLRGDGLLRAQASTGHPIALGFCIACGLALAVLLHPSIKQVSARVMLFSVLGLGLVAALSRGPWVGAVVALVVAMGLRPGGSRALVGFASAIMLGLLSLLVVGRLDQVIQYLPFVGTVDAEAVSYRQRLWEVSLDLLMRSPIFGVPGYMGTAEMEVMRQGEGIIDMVNTYMGVALAYGLVGLSLFVGPYLICVVTLLRIKPPETGGNAAPIALVRSGLLGLLVGVLVIIATTSTVSFIGVLVWALLGLGLAGAGVLRQQLETATVTGSRAASRSRPVASQA